MDPSSFEPQAFLDPRARRAVETRLRELVRHVVPTAKIYFPRRVDRRVRYSWNGRVLRPSGLSIESVCHEVAHLLICPSSRRRLAEFGLGPDPYRYSDARRVVPERESKDEERDACTMQLVLVRLLGLSEAEVMAEVRPKPLTLSRIRALRRRHPNALSPESWRMVVRRARFARFGKSPIAAPS